MSRSGAAAVYDEDYAERYDALYLHPWRSKHALNLRHLGRILAALPARPRWLDLACGQAWHFSQFSDSIVKVGIDLSLAQLRRAMRNAPAARFLQADMSEVELPDGCFDLVTNFWAGYCYLNSRVRIEALVRKAARWVRPGGALYFEVLPGAHLASFNDSRFAAETRFRVVPTTPDYEEWAYEDSGGLHEMTSPPVEHFLQWLAPSFRRVATHFAGGFMVDLIATGRLPAPGA